MSIVFEIKNATKNYKNITVFKDVNLIIKKGKSYGFIGPNGCGKSVFFKTLCGFSKLSNGKILYNKNCIGKNIDFIYDAGVIIETPDFIDNLTGLNNLIMISEFLGKVDESTIIKYMKDFNLYEDRNVTVNKYSLGMKQKLRLIQAFMEDPEVLILDEPTNFLDKYSATVVRKKLNRYIENGKTLLLASHNLDEINDCCDYIFEFENKQLNLIKESSHLL